MLKINATFENKLTLTNLLLLLLQLQGSSWIARTSGTPRTRWVKGWMHVHCLSCFANLGQENAPQLKTEIIIYLFLQFLQDVWATDVLDHNTCFEHSQHYGSGVVLAVPTKGQLGPHVVQQ